tara:strand:- start:426 stop:683 length:258 start_codon:yes stop_codon:yes gene_type:complete
MASKFNKIETRMVNQITELSEGILGTLANLFVKSKMKRKYKKVYSIAKDDPELQSALADLEDYHERLNKIMKNLCKRNPDHPKCK